MTVYFGSLFIRIFLVKTHKDPKKSIYLNLRVFFFSLPAPDLLSSFRQTVAFYDSVEVPPDGGLVPSYVHTGPSAYFFQENNRSTRFTQLYYYWSFGNNIIQGTERKDIRAVR